MKRTIIRLAAIVALVGVSLFSTVASTYAAEARPVHAGQTFAQSQPNPGGGLGAKIEAFTEQVKSVARPAGGLSLVLIGLSFAFAPAFRQWAEDNKRQFGLIIAGMVIVGAAGDIIAMFATS